MNSIQAIVVDSRLTKGLMLDLAEDIVCAVSSIC